MSVCDVPPCPNLSVGSIQPLMGAPKGVPRVNRAGNETRDRLRIRLNQRKAKHPFNPNVTYSVQFGALSKQAGEESCTDKSKKPEPTKPEPLAEKPVMTKKCSSETCTIKQTSCPVVKRCCGKKIEGKNCPGMIDFRAELKKEVEEAEAAAAAQAQSARQEQFEDIDKIMKFIEGKDYDIAQKKAAKKARQKQKKEEEKRKKEEAELVKRKAEEKRIREEKRLEEERLKAIELARQAALRKEKKNKNSLSTTNEVNKGKKKGKKGNKGGHIEHSEPELFEETIPAMVTIKRIVENNNSPPTVTITLKGSTPDQDKLLYTLVNGHNNRSGSESTDRPKENNKKEESKSSKKKKKGSENKTEVRDIKTKELKVTLAVDKSFRRELENKTAAKAELTSQKSKKQQAPVEIKEKPVKTKAKENIIDIPSLKLPPGITITKVNGPLTNRKVNNVQSSDYQNVPVNKSGVIVVDTEKLIQQSIGTKKNKKKKKKSQQDSQKEGVPSKPAVTQESSMVTLKNPIFHKIQNTINQPEAPHLLTINEQATISKGANGMVTIRRPRQAALQNESPISEYLAPVLESNQTLMNPNMNACYVESKSTLSDERKIIRPPSPRPTNSLTNATQIDLDSNRLSAQNVLWELPGIQITRVHKNNNAAYEGDNAAQTADISIIRTSGFNLEKDDWPYVKKKAKSTLY